MAESYVIDTSANGVKTSFDCDIEFMDSADIRVFVDNVQQMSGFSVTGVSGNADVVFGTPPVEGEELIFQRVTPSAYASREVDFGLQTFMQQVDVELNQKQLLLMIQEALETDDNLKVNPNAEYIRWDSTASEWEAASIPGGTERRIGGVADPASNQQVATKKYVDDIAEFGADAVPQHFNLLGTGGTSYTLTAGANIETSMCVVAVQGVLQQPVADYNVVKGDPDSTLVFASAVTLNDEITVINLGKARGTSGTIQDGAVTTNKLADNAVTKLKMADDSVGTAEIEDNAVTQAKIAALAVDTPEIAAGAVILSKLARDASFGGTIAAGVDRALMVQKSDGALIDREIQAGDIENLVTWLAARTLNELSAPSAPISMGSQKISNLADPTSAQDAATQAYVQAQTGLNASGIVRVLSETKTPAAREHDFGTGSWITSGYTRFYCTVKNWTSPNVTGIELHMRIGGTWYWRDFTTVAFPWITAGSATEPSEFGFWISNAINSGEYAFVRNESNGLQASAGGPFKDPIGATIPAGTITGVRLKQKNAAHTIPNGVIFQVYGETT